MLLVKGFVGICGCLVLLSPSLVYTPLNALARAGRLLSVLVILWH